MGTSLIARTTRALLHTLQQTARTVRGDTSLATLRGFAGPHMLVSLDAPSGVVAGLGLTTLPYLVQRDLALSAHARLAAEQDKTEALALRAKLHQAFDAAPGLAGWYGTIRIGVYADLTASIWIGDLGVDSNPRLLCNRTHADDIVPHIDALVRAARHCTPLPPTGQRRMWVWGGKTAQQQTDARPYPAADLVDAGLMGLGLHHPNLVRNALLGDYCRIEVHEHHPCGDLHLAIKARRDANDAAAKASKQRGRPNAAALHPAQDMDAHAF